LAAAPAVAAMIVMSVLALANPPIYLRPAFVLLKQFAATDELRAQIARIAEVAAFRHLVVRGGKTMSVAMTNCGAYGWTSSRAGYAYSATDPLSGRAWPVMPQSFVELARDAAATAGFADYAPDCCLINRYVVGASMGLHQDLDEHDLGQPIVSVSIGADATFIVGGLKRNDATRSVVLQDGDVLVWGGEDRLAFHGVRALKPTRGPDTLRYNLTFRRAR
jgi:DNA oxidative demethylase